MITVLSCDTPRFGHQHLDMEFSKCFEILQNRQNSSAGTSPTASTTQLSPSSCPCAHQSFTSSQLLTSSHHEEDPLISLQRDSQQFQQRTTLELISICQKLQEERVMVCLFACFIFSKFQPLLLVLPLLLLLLLLGSVADRLINNTRHHFK